MLGQLRNEWERRGTGTVCDWREFGPWGAYIDFVCVWLPTNKSRTMRGRNTRRHQASCEQRKFAVHSGRAVPHRSAAAWLTH